MDPSKSDLVIESCDKFANDVYKNVAIEETHNFVFSPFGAHVVLSMLAHGADGNTKVEMVKGLRLPENEDDFLQGLQTFINNLNSLTEVEAAIGATNFISNKLEIKPKYSEAITKYFSTSCNQLNFADRKKSAEVINAWCSKATKDNIKQIVTKDDLDETTEMLLLNTIYFKAEWKHKFHRVLTKCNLFHVNETETSNVPYMYQQNELYHGEIEDLDMQFLELPYKDERCKMVVLLPNKITGLSELERNIDRINHEIFMTHRQEKTVTVFLPKFCFESTIDLSDCLKKMGMNDMFDSKANFSKITDDNIKAVKVLQKSFIAIDEKGTVATTVTASIMNKMCRLIPSFTVFRADRPFIVMIMCDSLTLFYTKFMGDKSKFEWTFH